MRHIFLVDMNAFYIMCESIKRPELKQIPAAVAGDPKSRRGIILTSNYKARAYGVKTAMTINEALKLCPHMTLVKSTPGLYTDCSNAVFEIFKKYTPIIEQNSIDEGWLDVTNSTDLFGNPIAIAEKIQNEIKNELSLWCSIGISENKYLAKMAADIKKPMGITQMYKKDIKRMMWPMPVGKMHGVGKITAAKLIEIGLEKIGDIANASPSFINKKFGEDLYKLANGEGSDIVGGENEVKNASIGRSKTTAKNISNIEEAKKLMLELAEDVGIKARRKAEKGSTIQITLRYPDFRTITRQKTVFPTNLTKDIIKAGYELLEENWNSKKPVRLIGITLAGIDRHNKQLSVYDISIDEKQEKLERVMDDLKEKYGMEYLKRGRGL